MVFVQVHARGLWRISTRDVRISSRCAYFRRYNLLTSFISVSVDRCVGRWLLISGRLPMLLLLVVVEVLGLIVYFILVSFFTRLPLQRVRYRVPVLRRCCLVINLPRVPTCEVDALCQTRRMEWVYLISLFFILVWLLTLTGFKTVVCDTRLTDVAGVTGIIKMWRLYIGMAAEVGL